MLMTNEYGSAYKRAHSEEEMMELAASGWRRVEELPKAEPVALVQPKEEPPVEAPRIVKRESNRLTYKNRYLSQWAQTGTKDDLIKIFDYFGIPYAYKSSKNDMQKALRQYIRQVKAEKRSENDDGQ